MPHEKKRRSGGAVAGWVFLSGVALVYAVGALFDPGVVVRALTSLGTLLLRLLPALALVFVLMVVMNLFTDREKLAALFGRAKGLKASLLASLLGILSLGSIYAWYPLLAELRQKGLDARPVAAFLYGRALKLPLLPVMIQYFGVAYTATLSVAIIVFSVCSGIIVGRLVETTPQRKTSG